MKANGLEWRQHMRFAVSLMDQDHRALMERWDALVSSLERAHDEQHFRTCAAELVAAARRHFHNEEWAMRVLGYPEYQRHQSEHRRLVSDAHDMLQNLMTTAFHPHDWSALATYFRHWMLKHTAGADRELEAFIVRFQSPPGPVVAGDHGRALPGEPAIPGGLAMPDGLAIPAVSAWPGRAEEGLTPGSGMRHHGADGQGSESGDAEWDDDGRFAQHGRGRRRGI